jgi:hypothetical protein
MAEWTAEHRSGGASKVLPRIKAALLVEAVSSPFGAASLFSMPLPQGQLFAFSERIIWHLAGQFPRQ